MPVICLLAAVPALRAQGDAMLTHYWVVPTYYNPAAAGDTDNIRIRGGMRMQWVGIDNAPRTFLAAADMPFKFLGKRWGTGLVVQQESEGLFRNLTVSAQIGYKFKALKGEFTAAMQLGFFNEQFKGSEVFTPDDDDFHQSADDAIPTRDVAGNAFDMGIGVYYVHPRFKTGVSLVHALSPTVTFTSEGENTPTPEAARPKLLKNINSPRRGLCISPPRAIFRCAIRYLKCYPRCWCAATSRSRISQSPAACATTRCFRQEWATAMATPCRCCCRPSSRAYS